MCHQRKLEISGLSPIPVALCFRLHLERAKDGRVTKEVPLRRRGIATAGTPIASLMKTHEEALRARGAMLYWSGRRLEDLYGIDEAREWDALAEQLRFVPVLSEPDANWRGRSGFVHEAVARDFPDMGGMEVYACGYARSRFADCPKATRIPPSTWGFPPF